MLLKGLSFKQQVRLLKQVARAADVEATAEVRWSKKQRRKLKQLITKLPPVISSCSQVALCEMVDNQTDIAQLERPVRAAYRRAKKRIRGATIGSVAKRRLARKNQRVLSAALDQINAVPRFHCDTN
jgi:hypothetical protein